MNKNRSEPPSIPVKQPNQPQQPSTSSRADIEAFLDQVRMLDPVVKSGERGRLIFALDATMSRQPTWDQACHLQAEMFREAAAVGGLDLQLVYYRGLAECRASGWISEPKRFGELMSRIDCRGGQTQIAKILAHARAILISDIHAGARCRAYARLCDGNCRRYGAGFGRFAAVIELSARGIHQGSSLAAACPLFRYDFCPRNKRPTFQGPRIFKEISDGST